MRYVRCNNCGWDKNPVGRSRCEKCNAPLDGSIVGGEDSDGSRKDSDSNLSGTIQGEQPTMPFLDQDHTRPLGNDSYNSGRSTPKSPNRDAGSTLINCPSCGASVRMGISVCPYCQYSFDKKQESRPPTREGSSSHGPSQVNKPVSTGSKFKGTILPNRGGNNAAFNLELLGKDRTSEKVISFDGDSNVLNRDNLDPGNNTITSKEQAVIEFRDGNWYIINKSELKTSFIQIDDTEPVKLKDGSIIILGDREFIFRKPE